MRSRRPRRDHRQRLAHLRALDPQFVALLQVQEEPLAHPPVAGQTQIGVGGDGALAQDDLVDPARRHADGVGERSLAEIGRKQELLQQDFARVTGSINSSVVVADFDMA